MISETAWAEKQDEAEQRPRALAGQMIRPPALTEISPSEKERQNQGQAR